ncbi:MAG: glucose-1-phosphate thymidylyltransferase [Armatimonadia bacterium]
MSLANDLKAIVLCAGEGTRLRPLTFSKPKHLLPVAGRPLLGHVLWSLAEAGLREVGLVVGHHPEAVQRYVGDGELWGLTATYITQEQPLGLGHAVKQTRDFVGDNPFIVYLGDNLLENGINDFVQDFQQHRPDAALLLKAVPDPRRYGVAVLDDQQRVVRLVEKPADPPSNLAIVGVYAFQSAIFDAIDHIQPSARGELEITDAIQYLVDHGRTVRARIMQGFWEDAGEPRSLLVANRRYLDRLEHLIQGKLGSECTIEGTACIGKGTRITGSKLRGPCLIGRNCVIERSTIGPYASIGDGCVITDSHIEDSVIQDDCQISQLPAGLKGSVLGEKVQITGGAPMTGPLTMILGDMAQIRMF